MRNRTSTPAPTAMPVFEGDVPFRFPDARKLGPASTKSPMNRHGNVYLARTGISQVRTVIGGCEKSPTPLGLV